MESCKKPWSEYSGSSSTYCSISGIRGKIIFYSLSPHPFHGCGCHHFYLIFNEMYPVSNIYSANFKLIFLGVIVFRAFIMEICSCPLQRGRTLTHWKAAESVDPPQYSFLSYCSHRNNNLLSELSLDVKFPYVCCESD